jgi:26S proteasome regulatory subunit N4
MRSWQGMQREDLVVKFGHLTSQSFTSSSLQMLAELVVVSENVSAPDILY